MSRHRSRSDVRWVRARPSGRRSTSTDAGSSAGAAWIRSLRALDTAAIVASGATARLDYQGALFASLIAEVSSKAAGGGQR